MKVTTHEEKLMVIWNNVATQPKLNTFTCFIRLPKELRREIWTYFAHIPRNVDLLIKKGRHNAEIARGHPLGPEYEILSRSPHPALLSVCHESRDLGLEYYKLEFGTFLPAISNTSIIALEPPRVYVNWTVDRLCLINAAASTLYHEAAAAILARAGIMKAKSIAVNIHPRLGRAPDFNLHLTEFANKADADEVILVCQAPMSNSHAVFDADRRTNWEFEDFAATDSHNQQHVALGHATIAFNVLVRFKGLSCAEIQKLTVSEMMRDMVVRTRIRTCNECPQMV